MTDPFDETWDDDLMSRVKETATDRDSASTPEQILQTLTGRHVCPYCGFQSPDGTEQCPRCTMEDTPATRQATKSRIGPWYLLQSRNPAAPGMKYATLIGLIGKGHVTPRSVVRGPTTHQLWRYAAHVRGVSREFGLCYSCAGSIEKTCEICPHCERSQVAPSEPDVLLDARTNGHPAAVPAKSAPPAETVPAPVSYAQRMQELNRQRLKNEHPPRGEVPMIRPRSEVAPRGNGRVVSAMELAAALQDDPNKSLELPRRFALKAAALFLLVAGAAAAGTFYFKPEYRQPAMDWMNNSWSSIKTTVASIEWPTVSTGPSPAPATIRQPAPRPEIAAPVIPAEPVVVIPPPAPTPPPVAPAPEPAAPVAEAVEKPAPAISIEAASEEARRLWVEALQAEERQDFDGAVKLYLQIKALPPAAQQKNLDLNLNLARRRLASGNE